MAEYTKRPNKPLKPVIDKKKRKLKLRKKNLPMNG